LNHVTIVLPAIGDPLPASCSPGDQIRWSNETNQPVTSFTLPSCVAPQTDPAPIQPHTVTSYYHVKADPKAPYPYSYAVGPADDKPTVILDTRSGTIDVS
jgi:hypothetical protein